MILRLTQPIRNAADPAYSQWVDQVEMEFLYITRLSLFMIYLQCSRWKKPQISYFQLMFLLIPLELHSTPF